jgi:Brp/Blh family beta-carotene 15,15'-monooxygenase
VQPVAGFAFFIFITWFHWGQGDLWLDRALGRTPSIRLDAVLTVLVRGGLPMLVPLIAHPNDYATVLHGTTALLGAHAGASTALLESFTTRATASAILTLAIAAHLLVRHRAGARLRSISVEIVVLVLFFVTVPPVLAVGLYFTFWHAVRHIVRLELLTDSGRTALQQGRLLQPFARFLLDALPITACAVALLAAVSLLVHSASLGSYLLLIAALTTPHTAVVTWMDRRRRKNSSQKAEGDFALAVERITPPPDVRHTHPTSRD